MNTQEEGFECEFVEKPPSIFQSECPVCLLVLREPYQVNCCGYAFCRVCIEKVKADKQCPCCNAKDFYMFEDKRLKRTIYALRIRCTNKEQGCQWEGELGQLDNHLNYNPPEEKQLKGCQFSKIKCLYCSKLFLRLKIQVHQSDQCQRRSFSCQYCKDYKTTYEDVSTNHWSICGYYPLECSNKCGQTLERQHLESHISKDCPLTVVDCDFQHVGCEVRLHRKDMPAHLVQSVVLHLSLQATKFKEVAANVKRLEEEKLDVKQDVVRLEKDNKELRKQVEKLTEDLQAQEIYIPICSVEFIITKFEQQKRDKKVWRSPPFYTHLKGYKMMLEVDMNGYGTGADTHISTFIILMKGEFDDQIKWPFRGSVEIQLLNQEQNNRHIVKRVDFNLHNFGMVGERVLLGRESNVKNGASMFISHNYLRPMYLKNDCLIFRIIKI